MNEEPIAVKVAKLEAMRSKAFALGGPLGNLLSKSFDLLTNAVRKSTEDRKSLGYALESFSNERRFAESKDAERNEPLRHVLYGLTEGIEMMGTAMIEEWNEAAERNMKMKKEEKMEDEAMTNSSIRSNSVITPHPGTQETSDSGREAAAVSQLTIQAHTPTVPRSDQRQPPTAPVQQPLTPQPPSSKRARINNKPVPHQPSGCENDVRSTVQLPQPQLPSEIPAPIEQQDNSEGDSKAQEAEALPTPSATRESTPALKTPKRKPTLLDTYFNSAKKAKKVLDDDDIIIVEEAAPAAPATPTAAKTRAAPAAETPATPAAAAAATPATSETPAGAPLDPAATDRKSRKKRKSERRSKKEKIDGTTEPAIPAAAAESSTPAAVSADTPSAADKPSTRTAAMVASTRKDQHAETPVAKKRDDAAMTPAAVATPSAQAPVAATTPATAKRVSPRTGRRSVRAPQLEEVTMFKCEVEGCEEAFDTKKKLGTHALKHKGIQCNICGNYMKNETSFIEHLLRIHNIDVIAEQAQAGEANKENDENDEKEEEEQVEKESGAEEPEHKSIQCNKCGNYVKDETSFIEHLLKIHNIDVFADQGEEANKENDEQEEVEKERRAEEPERQMDMEGANEPSAPLEEAETPAATPSDRKRRRTEKVRDGNKHENKDEDARKVKTPKTDGAVKKSQWSSFVDRSMRRDDAEKERDGNSNDDDDEDEVRKTKRDAASKKSRRSSARDRSLTSDEDKSATKGIAPSDEEELNVDELLEKIANPASAKKRRRPKPKRRPAVVKDDAMMDLDHKDTPSRPRRSRMNSDEDKVAEDTVPYDDDIFDKEDYPDVKKADVLRFLSFCIRIKAEHKPNAAIGELVKVVEISAGKILADDKKVVNEAKGSTPATPILAPIFNRSVSRGQTQSAKRSLLSSAVKESFNQDIEGDGRFHCPQCGITRSTQSIMTAHVRDVHGVKPYGCDRCEKTFAKKVELVHHQKLHQEKPGGDMDKDNAADEEEMMENNEEEKIEEMEKTNENDGEEEEEVKENNEEEKIEEMEKEKDDEAKEEGVLEEKKNENPEEEKNDENEEKIDKEEHEDQEMKDTSEETEKDEEAKEEEALEEKEEKKDKEDNENIEENEDQEMEGSEETEKDDESKENDAIEEKEENPDEKEMMADEKEVGEDENTEEAEKDDKAEEQELGDEADNQEKTMDDEEKNDEGKEAIYEEMEENDDGKEEKKKGLENIGEEKEESMEDEKKEEDQDASVQDMTEETEMEEHKEVNEKKGEHKDEEEKMNDNMEHREDVATEEEKIRDDKEDNEGDKENRDPLMMNSKKNDEENNNEVERMVVD